MGKINSRNKGRYGEMAVRDYFRARGWEANRVPLSGAFAKYSKAGQDDYRGDVTISKNGQTLIVEVKFRKDDFKKIYSDFLPNPKQERTCRMSIGNVFVTLSYDFESLNIDESAVQEPEWYKTVEKPTRTHKKLVKMQELLKGADLLVIKINNKPLVFIKYIVIVPKKTA